MRVLDENAAKSILRVSKIGCYTFSSCFFRYNLRVFNIDLVMALGRPTSTYYSIDGYPLACWILSLRDKDLYYIEIQHRTVPRKNKHFCDPRNLDLRQAGKLVCAAVGMRGSVHAMVGMRKDNDELYELFRSQIKWIKDGSMEHELSMLGDVQPLIEPIDKNEWIEGNLSALSKLRKMSSTSEKADKILKTLYDY